jgi:hypothetical protein
VAAVKRGNVAAELVGMIETVGVQLRGQEEEEGGGGACPRRCATAAVGHGLGAMVNGGGR